MSNIFFNKWEWMIQWLGLWGRKNGFAQRVGEALPSRPASINSKQRFPNSEKMTRENRGREGWEDWAKTQGSIQDFWNWFCRWAGVPKSRQSKWWNEAGPGPCLFWTFLVEPVLAWTPPEGGSLVWSPPWDMALGKASRNSRLIPALVSGLAQAQLWQLHLASLCPNYIRD